MRGAYLLKKCMGSFLCVLLLFRASHSLLLVSVKCNWQKNKLMVWLLVKHWNMQFHSLVLLIFLSFLAFDFCRFCMVIRFFHPRHNGQWPPTSKDFYTRSYPLHYFPILIHEKEPVFSFWMFSTKQGHFWYHFYNIFGMTQTLTGGLNLGPPALEASTIPLGYRGGGVGIKTWNILIGNNIE